jgi:hypothetical protein
MVIESVTERQNVEIIRASGVATREHSSIKHTKVMRDRNVSDCWKGEGEAGSVASAYTS